MLYNNNNNNSNIIILINSPLICSLWLPTNLTPLAQSFIITIILYNNNFNNNNYNRHNNIININKVYRQINKLCKNRIRIFMKKYLTHLIKVSLPLKVL